MSELESLLDGVEDHNGANSPEEPEYIYPDTLLQTRSRPSSIPKEQESHLSATSKPTESTHSHLQKNSYESTSSQHPTLSSDCEISVSQLQSQDSVHFQEESLILGVDDSPSQGLAEIDKFYDLGRRKDEIKDPASQPSLGSPFQTPVRKPSERRETADTQPKFHQIVLTANDKMDHDHAVQPRDAQQGGETNDSSSDSTSEQEDIVMEDVLGQQTSQQSSDTHVLPSHQMNGVNKVSSNRIISHLQSGNTNVLFKNASEQSNSTVVQQPAIILDDSDDDLMMIEPSAASAFAKSKWSGEKNNTFSQPGDDSVKQEPTENMPATQPAPALANINTNIRLPNRTAAFAAQKAMLESSSAPLSPVQPAPGRDYLTLPQIPESSESQSHIGIEIPTILETQDEGASTLVREHNVDEVDAAMGGTDHFAEDNNWMHENAEDDQDEIDEYNQILRFKELLEKKESLEGLNLEERMELNRARNQLMSKNRLREAAQVAALPDNDKHKQTGKKSKKATVEDEEDQDSLFLPESSRDKVQRQRHIRRQAVSPLDDADDDISMAIAVHESMSNGLGSLDRPQDQVQPPDYGLTKAGKQRKRRPKAKDAREVIQRQQEDKIEKERKKEQKKKAREEKTSASRARKPLSSPKSRKGKGKQKKSKRKTASAIKNSTSLHHASRTANADSTTRMMLNLVADDPLQNRLYNPIFNAHAEAEIVGRQNKESQFSQLFSNIPTQADIGGMGGGLNEIRSDKKALREASKAFGFAKVTAENGKWRIKGMKSLLYHHQLLGAQWMVQRELSSTKPHGGLLADAMGLGKTVQMLACMVGNPPTDGDLQRNTKATLIIVPAAVMDQWIDEIDIHINKDIFPKILRYKRAHNIPPEILEDCDIVVTSYTDVMKEFPHPENKEEKAIWKKLGFSKWFERFRDRLGPLHRVRWYRIVLDEAQAIKNNCAHTSISCMNLKGVYRWCLSGTPLLNRLEELFPYLRFLRAEYSLDYATFQKYFCDPNNEDCYSRIATVLGYTMMRRTMATTILNRPIITLPKPHPVVLYVDFSREEQIIYRITENRFRSNLNKFFRQGEAERNYSTFMVQLLRLRQCTSHPFMLEATIKEMWTLEDINLLKKKLEVLKVTDDAQQTPFYKQCQAWVEKSESCRLVRDKEVVEEMLPFGASKYGHDFNMDKALDTLNEKQMMTRLNCAICQDLPYNPVQTDCTHIFCEECISTYMHDQTVIGIEDMSCPSCGSIFSNLQPIDLPSGMRADEDDYIGSPASTFGGTKNKGKGKGQAPSENPYSLNDRENSKGRDVLGCEPKTKYSTWITRSDVDDEFPLAPSAKTTMLKCILLKGFEEAPADKVVIYVQFRALARIVGRICNHENWQFLYLTGDSNLEHRSRVIKRFRDDINVKILVAGLKCGGLGLNFPWANRCISLDLWWNHAVEQQAFGRIFRIGQCKETYMTRIVVKSSVDMRMLTMQLHKLKSLEKAMRDGVEKAPLSLVQITNLFGFLKTDEDNNILSVEPDYLEDDDDNGGDNGEGNAAGMQED